LFVRDVDSCCARLRHKKEDTKAYYVLSRTMSEDLYS
jgi:hypothetical protein